MDLNLLIRGQSNALLFVQNGGAAALEATLEAATGRDVNVIASWDDPAGNNTINSGSAFMDWDADGKEAGLRRVLEALPADIKDNPTLTVWMHNEYDQKDPSLTEAAWEGEVRTAIEGERAALGQDASTTPVEFVPIRYPYGPNFGAIGDGMAALDADAGFNAGISWAARNAAMDGGPEPGNNSSHMGQADALMIGNALGDELAPAMKLLAAGGGGIVMPTPTPAPPPTPGPTTAHSGSARTPASLSAGSGPDTLVLKVSQDAWRGNAEYTVKVDGAQVGGTFTASASRAADQSDTLTLKGDWSAGTHQVSVEFLNDAWGGTAATDRNLYVDGGSYNGTAVQTATATLWSAGASVFSFADGEAAAPPAGSGTIDWAATNAVVQAHFDATGSWGNLSDYLVFA